MASRGTRALLAALVLVGGLAWLPGQFVDGSPSVTVTNEGDDTYRVTAFPADGHHAALLANVAITTRDGERRLAPVSQLVWPDGYRNVTVVDEPVTVTRLTVAPGETATTRVDGWSRGDATVYLAEELDANETHVWTEVDACPDRGQEFTLTFTDDGAGSWSSTCAGGVGWWLA